MGSEVEVLEFRSNKNTPMMTGAITGIMGLFNIGLFLMAAREGAPFFLVLVGLVLLAISVTAFTYRSVVRIDRERGQVIRRRSNFFWKQSREYSLSSFRSVGLGMAGQASMTTSSLYSVRLLGSDAVNLPGMIGNRQGIASMARQLAEYARLPMDEKPRFAFFQVAF